MNLVNQKTSKIASDIPLDQIGKQLYSDKGCVACHGIDGAAGVGPSWKGLYNAKRIFTWHISGS